MQPPIVAQLNRSLAILAVVAFVAGLAACGNPDLGSDTLVGVAEMAKPASPGNSHAGKGGKKTDPPVVEPAPVVDPEPIVESPALPATLLVGPGLPLSQPSDAALVARDGDVIDIAAGDYRGDVAVWTAPNLTVRAAGGPVRLFADGVSAQGKGIWVVQGANMVIEGIEFHDAKVADRNGAGIRAEGPSLTVRNSKFFNNEDGILTSNDESATLVVENSEFGHNGFGDGYSHNLYAGKIAALTVRDSYFHEAVVGHQLKSRAKVTLIERSTFSDLDYGNSSYAIDLPNGGDATIVDSVVVKGLLSPNHTLISYGAEGLYWSLNRLAISGSQLVNPFADGRFLFVKQGTESLVLENNTYVGPALLP